MDATETLMEAIVVRLISKDYSIASNSSSSSSEYMHLNLHSQRQQQQSAAAAAATTGAANIGGRLAAVKVAFSCGQLREVVRGNEARIPLQLHEMAEVLFPVATITAEMLPLLPLLLSLL